MADQPLPPLAPPAEVVTEIRSDAEALEAVREIAAHLAEGAQIRDQARELPFAALKFARDHGIGAIAVPAEYGGAGVSAQTLWRVTAIIAGADASIAQILLNDFYLTASLRGRVKTRGREEIAALALSGHGFGNATSEIGTRQSNEFRTRIWPVPPSAPESWVVTGEKFYTTGSLFAHYVSVTGLAPDGSRTTALVARESAGIRYRDDWDGFGQRTTASGTMIFDDVHVPPHRVSHSQDSALLAPLGTVAQLLHAAIDFGIAEAAHLALNDYIRSRARPWRNTGLDHAQDDPYILAASGRHSLRLHAAEAMMDRAAALITTALEVPSEEALARAAVATAEAKILTTEAALEITTGFFQYAGARATSSAFGFDRYLRDARVHTAHDPLHWKLHIIGNYHLNNRPPPRDGSV